jgi:hypothetical protein
MQLYPWNDHIYPHQNTYPNFWIQFLARASRSSHKYLYLVTPSLRMLGEYKNTLDKMEV